MSHKQKLEYEKPSINRLNVGQMNKFGGGRSYYQSHRDDIDGVSIKELIKEFGSPLFVFSERIIRETIREAKRSFAHRYPKVTFGWSYKTNYLSAICKVFHQEGSMAEVVSEMEYEKARHLGVAGKDIIFNGPKKSYESLKRAVQEGAKIHVDHFDEVSVLEKIADELKQTIPIGIRLNLDSGIYQHWYRFGFNLESGQAMNVVTRIYANRKLIIRGLHCHLATYVLEPNAYTVQIEKMTQFARQIKEQFGYDIQYYDLGGGFPSKSTLKGSLISADATVPDFDTFAETICDALYCNLPHGGLPDIYLESGRALIDEAGFLITSVVSSKRLPDGLKSYVIDAGVNLLYTSTWFKYKIEVAESVTGVAEPSVLFGPLCMNIDVVDEQLNLPPLSKGTPIVLSPVGAYNVTQWMQFIEYRPAVVMISENGKVAVIREAECLSDLIAKEKIPDFIENHRQSEPK